MKKIRKGNDIKVTWSLVKEGNPYSLEGVELSLYLKNAFGKSEITDFTISGNSVIWNFYGKDQKHVGKYTLEIVINENEIGMVTTDFADFVYLTPETPCCEGTDDENITTETIELTSAVDLAPVVIQGEGGSGLKYSEERTIYGIEGDLTEEQREYNIETYNKLMAGEAVTINFLGWVGTPSSLFPYPIIIFVIPYGPFESFIDIHITETGDVIFEERTVPAIIRGYSNETIAESVREWVKYPEWQSYDAIFLTNNSSCAVIDFKAEVLGHVMFCYNSNELRTTYICDKNTGEILDQEVVLLGGNGGGGSVDPELLEGYMPLAREFSDDFNNDFAR